MEGADSVADCKRWREGTRFASPPSLSGKMTLHSGNTYQELEDAKLLSEDGEQSVKILPKSQIVQACARAPDMIGKKTHLLLPPGEGVLFGDTENKQKNPANKHDHFRRQSVLKRKQMMGSWAGLRFCYKDWSGKHSGKTRRFGTEP